MLDTLCVNGRCLFLFLFSSTQISPYIRVYSPIIVLWPHAAWESPNNAHRTRYQKPSISTEPEADPRLSYQQQGIKPMCPRRTLTIKEFSNTPLLPANISGRIICPLFFFSFDVSFPTDPRPQSCMSLAHSSAMYSHILYCSTLESLRVVLRLLSSSSVCSTFVLNSSFRILSSLLISNMSISFLVSLKVATYLRQTLLSSKATRAIWIFKFVMISLSVECILVPLSTIQLGRAFRMQHRSLMPGSNPTTVQSSTSVNNALKSYFTLTNCMHTTPKVITIIHICWNIRLQNFKDEDMTCLGLQIWLLGISLIIVLYGSVPHT